MEPDIQQGQKPSPDELFYHNWAREAQKDNLVLLNDILRQLLTISAALLGVSIFYDKVLSSEGLRLIVVLAFFVSLMSALYGILPFIDKFNLNNPAKVKEFKLRSFHQKRNHIWVCSIALTIGFALIIVSLIAEIVFNYKIILF